MPSPNTERLYISKKPNNIFCSSQYYKYIYVSTYNQTNIIFNLFRWSVNHVKFARSILYTYTCITINAFIKKYPKKWNYYKKFLYKKKSLNIENNKEEISLVTTKSTFKNTILKSKLLNMSNPLLKKKIKYKTNIYKINNYLTYLFDDKYNNKVNTYVRHIQLYDKNKTSIFDKKKILNIGHEDFYSIGTRNGFNRFLLNYIGFYIKMNLRYKNPIAFVSRKLKFFLLKYIKQNLISGYRIRIKGPFKASSRSKTVWLYDGILQTSTISCPVEYDFCFLHTKYGIFGIKIWIGYNNSSYAKNIFIKKSY